VKIIVELKKNKAISSDYICAK